MPGVIAALNVLLGLETKQFEAGSDKVRAKFKHVDESAKRTEEAIEGVKHAMEMVGVGLSIEAAVDSFKELVAEGAKELDMLNRLSSRVGSTIDELHGLSYSAKLVGIDAETMGEGLMKAERALGQLQAGNAEKTAAFGKLGFSAEDLKGLGAVGALEEVADRFAMIQNAEDRAALATDLFGKAGLSLIPILEQGGDKLREQAEMAELLAGRFTQEQADKVSQHAQAYKRLQETVEGVGKDMAVMFAEHAGMDFWDTMAIGIRRAEAGLVDVLEGFERLGAWLADHKALAKFIAPGISWALPGNADELRAHADELNKKSRELNAQIQELQKKLAHPPEVSKGGGGTGELPEGAEGRNKALEHGEQLMNAAADAETKFNREFDALNAAFDRHKGSPEEYAAALEKLLDAFNKDTGLTKLLDELAKLEDAVRSPLEKYEDAIKHIEALEAEAGHATAGTLAARQKALDEFNKATGVTGEQDRLTKLIDDAIDPVQKRIEQAKKDLEFLQGKLDDENAKGPDASQKKIDDIKAAMDKAQQSIDGVQTLGPTPSIAALEKGSAAAFHAERESGNGDHLKNIAKSSAETAKNTRNRGPARQQSKVGR